MGWGGGTHRHIWMTLLIFVRSKTLASLHCQDGARRVFTDPWGTTRNTLKNKKSVSKHQSQAERRKKITRTLNHEHDERKYDSNIIVRQNDDRYAVSKAQAAAPHGNEKTGHQNYRRVFCLATIYPINIRTSEEIHGGSAMGVRNKRTSFACRRLGLTFPFVLIE